MGGIEAQHFKLLRIKSNSYGSIEFRAYKYVERNMQRSLKKNMASRLEQAIGDVNRLLTERSDFRLLQKQGRKNSERESQRKGSR